MGCLEFFPFKKAASHLHLLSIRSLLHNQFTMTQSVLLLGSGFVAKPCLDVLANAGINVTVGTYFSLAIALLSSFSVRPSLRMFDIIIMEFLR